MTSKKTPKKFVGLHAHSDFSIGDGLGHPSDHINYAIKNGMDGLALTDHGNMNGFSHQYFHAKKIKDKGINFKALPGVEAYFVPSLENWQKLYEQSREEAKQAKIAKKAKEIKEQTKKLIGDAHASTKEDMMVGQAHAELDEETKGDSGVEDEDASKTARWKNPLFQRNHLVLLPKNNEGLKALFSCISYSFIHGFYRFPRMDFALLEKYAKGNIVASSACIAGLPSRIIFDNQIETEWEKFTPNDDNKEKIQKELAEMVARFHQALGEENFYLELQFNKLGAQHLANYHMIECAKRTGVKLVVTADSHYSNPDHWREREIYRLMARMQFMKSDKVELPESVDELKCQLYPKNAEQIWESYQELKPQYDFYDDEVICDAIERTHEIAHEQIDDIEPDRRVKFPALSRIVDKKRIDSLYEKLGEGLDEDAAAFEELKKLTIKGAKFRGIDEKDEYIDRLKTELSVVKHLKFSKYFLTYSKIMNVINEECLTGPGRGSGAGSLLCFVLNITQVDPIKNGLLFERFLTKFKKCLAPNTYVLTNDNPKQMKNLNVGDFVLTHTGQYQKILYKSLEKHELIFDIELEDGTKFTCSPNHKWIVRRNGKQIEIQASELLEGDDFIKKM